MNFAKRLKELRTERKLTQSELADHTGLTKSSISMYETGNRLPELETFELLADFFNVNMDYLKGKSDTKNPSFEGMVYDETTEYLKVLHQRPEMKMLFKTATKKNKAQIENLVKLIESFDDESD